ncbi:MAG: protein kinase, partial [Rickettsiales bacterium]|nr:protein kinase [Rickettsiales bacterium]
MDKINDVIRSGFIISNLLTNRPIEIANPHPGSGGSVNVQLSLEEERTNMELEEERNMEVFVTNTKVVYGKRFVLGKLLGSGAHAEAYSVNDQVTGKTYVLKCTTSSDPINYIGDFNYAEVFRYTAIGSSGLIKYHGTTLTGDKCGVILMEYCEGGDLNRYLPRKSSAKDASVVPGPGNTVRQEAAKIVNENFINLLYAVALLERRGYQNLDIKPDNIFLRKNSKDGSLVCCIGDFGLMVNLDIAKVGGGTEKYCPPEVVAIRSSSLEGRDSYALALTMLCVLHGKCAEVVYDADVHNNTIEEALEIASAHGANPIIAEILRTMCAFNVKERLGASRVVEFLKSRENRERKKREEKSPTNSEPTILKPTNLSSIEQKLKDIIDNADEGLYNAMMEFRRAREVEEREEIEKEKKEREETTKELAEIIVGAKLGPLFSSENREGTLVLKDVEPVGGKKNGRFSNYRVFSEAMNKHLLVKLLEGDCKRYRETSNSFTTLISIFGVGGTKNNSGIITVVVMEFCRWGKLWLNPSADVTTTKMTIAHNFLQLLEAYGKIKFMPSKDDFFIRDDYSAGILERSRETKQSIAPEKGVVAVPNAAVVAPSAAVVVPTVKDFVIIFLELLGSDKVPSLNTVLSIEDISLPLYLGDNIRPFLANILYKMWTSSSMGDAIVIAKQIITTYSNAASARKVMQVRCALIPLDTALSKDKLASESELNNLRGEMKSIEESIEKSIDSNKMKPINSNREENEKSLGEQEKEKKQIELKISVLKDRISVLQKQLSAKSRLKNDIWRCDRDKDRMDEVQFCSELETRRLKRREEEKKRKEEEERKRKEEEEKKIREEEERKRKEEEERKRKEEEERI